MKAGEIVKNILTDKKMNQNDLTQLLGMQSQSAVSQALNRNLKVATLVRFLSALDCELVIRNGNKEFKVDE